MENTPSGRKARQSILSALLEELDDGMRMAFEPSFAENAVAESFDRRVSLDTLMDTDRHGNGVWHGIDGEWKGESAVFATAPWNGTDLFSQALYEGFCVSMQDPFLREESEFSYAVIDHAHRETALNERRSVREEAENHFNITIYAQTDDPLTLAEQVATTLERKLERRNAAGGQLLYF